MTLGEGGWGRVVTDGRDSEAPEKIKNAMKPPLGYTEPVPTILIDMGAASSSASYSYTYVR